MGWISQPENHRQRNTAPCLHGKHWENSGTKPAGNREKVANPHQTTLEKRRKGQADGALLPSPFQWLEQLCSLAGYSWHIPLHHLPGTAAGF